MPNKKNIFINIALILIFGSIVFISSCDDTITGDEIDSVVIPEQNVNYYTYIQPIFNVKCNYSGCHDGSATSTTTLSLTSYTGATADPLIVFPGNPDQSRLVWAIEGQSGASSMPPINYPGLTKNQIQGIRTWIAEGAEASTN